MHEKEGRLVGRKVTVSNPSGLHIKPAGQLVKAAERCSSRVEIIYDYSIINARSLLNILSAAIPNGADIELRCTGPMKRRSGDDDRSHGNIFE